MENATMIYIVEDEPNIRNLLSFILQEAGFQTTEFEDGEGALQQILAAPPDLVLLDLMLPGIEGGEVCHKIRANSPTADTPVIMLTARGEELDRVEGLNMGADDYITKPFSTREVIARINAVLRRSSRTPVVKPPVLAIGNITVDFDERIVTKNGEPIALSMKEFDLFRYLIENRGRVLTRQQILDHVWGYEYVGETRTVDVHVRYLRLKVEDDADNPRLIETVRGVGYRLKLKAN